MTYLLCFYYFKIRNYKKMEKRLQIIKKEIEKVKTRNCKILDIGCGNGYLLRLITKQKRTGIGIDISKNL